MFKPACGGQRVTSDSARELGDALKRRDFGAPRRRVPKPSPSAESASGQGSG